MVNKTDYTYGFRKFDHTFNKTLFAPAEFSFLMNCSGSGYYVNGTFLYELDKYYIDPGDHYIDDFS